MRLTRYSLWVLLLLLTTAATGVGLLLVSGWFISACALAGAAGIGVTFNYVIPSAMIRLLSFVRIISGYGSNYFGHDLVLTQLVTLRQKLFKRVMLTAITRPHAEWLQLLEQHITALANRELMATLPTLAAVTMVVALGAWLVVIEAQGVWLFVATVAALLVLAAFYRAHSVQANAYCAQCTAAYRLALAERLRGASLWHLGNAFISDTRAHTRWHQAWVNNKRVNYRAGWWLQAIAVTATLGALVLVPESYMGSPVVILLPLLFLVLPEWLGPALRAQQAQAEAQLAKRSLTEPLSAPQRSKKYQQHCAAAEDSETHTDLLANSHCAITTLHISEFYWQRDRLQGQCLSRCFNKGELVGIQGDSGCGKTSLLLALAGLLRSHGHVWVNSQSQQPWSADLRRQHFHYCEQHPYVLADTLRNNLLIANPVASDEHLQAALAFAGLSHLHTNLAQWLGEQGRLLSGGERKRLGLARAWLTDNNIWLLDEPFEGLDTASQQRLALRIQHIIKQRIVFLVSHRPVTGLDYHQVITLGNAVINTRHLS